MFIHHILGTSGRSLSLLTEERRLTSLGVKMSTGVLQFVRGMDLSGNDFSVGSSSLLVGAGLSDIHACAIRAIASRMR